jgi:hypothetical protein
MATTAHVIEQGLSLPKRSRKLVVRRLFESLEKGHRLPPSLEEMLRRVDEIKRGTVKTYSREDVARDRAKLRAAAVKRLQSK